MVAVRKIHIDLDLNWIHLITFGKLHTDLTTMQSHFADYELDLESDDDEDLDVR